MVNKQTISIFGILCFDLLSQVIKKATVRRHGITVKTVWDNHKSKPHYTNIIISVEMEVEEIRPGHHPHRSGAGIKYQPKNDYMETWTFFYLRRLLLFARLSYYFIPCLRLTKSSTILSTRFPVSTQQVSIWSLKMLLIYFFQNGHFWNVVCSFCCL